MSEKKSFSFHFGLSDFLFVIFFLFSSVMLAFSSKSFVLNFNKIGFTILSTAQTGIYYVASNVKRTVTTVQKLSELCLENEELMKKLKNYELLQRSNAEIRMENERLKKLLDFTISLEQKNIPAHIISRDLGGIYSSITVNKGSMHGVKKNMSVIAIQNVTTGIVGKVVTVGRYTSQIMPIYDIKCSISARIRNTRDIGLVSGQGTFSNPLKLQYVRDEVFNELQLGDIVVTSGENDNYLADIPIGSISKISKVPYNSLLIIDLQPAIDFMQLENVVIVEQRSENEMEID